MSKLSSETLFHYVSDKKHLIDILENNFRPRYVIEKLHFESGDLHEIGIPMLCFCDIALSNIEEHVEWYGEYGIGMNKEWGIRKGLTPVHYYNERSHTIGELSKSISELRSIVEQDEVANDKATTIRNGYIGLYYNLWFMKLYEGEQFSIKSNKTETKKFYDEREWRYIPSIGDLKNLNSSLPMSIQGGRIEEFKQDSSYRNQLNRNLGDDTRLSFNPEDIAYIIIATENDRREFIDAIKFAKNRYEEDIVEVLFSKIISLEQIRRDF